MWIVDPEAETIEVHTTGKVWAAGLGETVGWEVVPGFSLAPREVFRAWIARQLFPAPWARRVQRDRTRTLR